jgi:hypothetical protein
LLSLQWGLIVLWWDLPHTLSHARNKRAAFLARSSTWYSFLFEDMVKCLLPMERKWVARTMCPGEREPIARKPHYRPRFIRLNRINPRLSGSANNARYPNRTRCNIQARKSIREIGK